MKIQDNKINLKLIANYQANDAINRVKGEGGVTSDQDEKDYHKQNGHNGNNDGAGSHQKEQEIVLTGPHLDTSSQVKKTILGITAPFKK